MPAPDPAAAPLPPRRLLDFWSGGWVLALAAIVCVLVVVQWSQRALQRPTLIGDGRHVASYGFDLTTCLLPRDELVAAGFSKDRIAALVDPHVLTIEEAREFSRDLRKAQHQKFLVPTDRVVGVVLNGAARAYPLKLLSWHEVANDTLGGRPIAVSYHPLCDSVVVFDRRVGAEVLEFRISGLLYNSNQLLYDRRADPTEESLWSQLQFRAVTGPAAARGATLERIPAVVTHWSDWEAQHPDTTVLDMVRTQAKLYKRSYQPYFDSADVIFPVTPLPPAGSRAPKDPVLAVYTADGWRSVALAEIAVHATVRGEDGSARWATELGGTPVHLHYRPKPAVAWATAPDGTPLDSVSALWFAWYAFHEAATLSSTPHP